MPFRYFILQSLYSDMFRHDSGIFGEYTPSLIPSKVYYIYTSFYK